MTVKRLKYPLGRQDFRTLREDGCVYVDKTEIMYDLIEYNKYVFLSRPRRFGKSLLLSTIRYYLEGCKDLFEGLKVMELEEKWTKHEVFHLSFASLQSYNKDSMVSIHEEQFQEWENKYGITNRDLDYAQRFRVLIKAAYQSSGQRVAILIDEYDNPLINTIHNPAIYDGNRSLLKSVYSNLKDMDEYIKFAMLTGVSRFSNTSVFSGLNNIKDITFSNSYSAICGFTYEEIKEYMWEGVERYAAINNIGTIESLEQLKEEYDGYHFTEDLIDIYNPYSLLNCLHDSKIDNYWMQSGLPEFLVRKLEKNPMPFSKLFSAQATTITLSTVDAAFDAPVALFYQTGYLTIKGYDKETREFRLGIPNKEVNEGLFKFLLGAYSFNDPSEGSRYMKEMVKCLQQGDPEGFLSRLQSLLAPIGYHLQGKMTEVDFERTMFVIFHILGFHVHSELATSYGRIDLMVETKEYVYVMEIKLGHSAQEALEQIEKKDYALAWKHDGRKVFKIGISFNSGKRNIEEWKIVES